MDPKSSKIKKQRIMEKITPYAFVSPFYILFLIFGLFPVVFSGILAFSKWDGIGEREFVGFENFQRLVQDAEFWGAVWNTLVIWVLSTVPMLLVALLLAFTLNLKFIKHKEWLKALYFVPNVTSVVAVTILFGLAFSSQTGLVNAVIEMFGGKSINWIRDPLWVKVVIAIIGTWQYLGYNMIIYFTGLQKIPKDYYEAAIIDGATTFQLFRLITIPLLKPIILFTVMMSTIGGLQVFAEAQILVPSNPTAEGGALTIVYYLYQTAFRQNAYGYGAAIAWGLVVLILLLSLLNWYLTTYRIKGTN